MPSAVSRGSILRTSGGERVRYNCVFRPNGAGAPLDVYSPDNLMSVAREGPTGQYLLTIVPGVVGTRTLVGNECSLQMNGVHGNRAYLGDGPVANANGSVVYRIYTVNAADAAVDLAAAGSTRISFWIELEER